MGNKKRIQGDSLWGRSKVSQNGSQGRPGASSVEGQDYPGEGAINAYRCPDCERYMVVRHVDTGVTPMFMTCMMTEGCTGRTVSLMYPKNPTEKVINAVRFEWYRPDWAEFRELAPEMKAHVNRGGLVLRELDRPSETEQEDA